MEFREEDDEQRRFEYFMEDILPGVDTKGTTSRSSRQEPEEPSEDEARTLSRRMSDKLRREHRADVHSRKMRRMTIPTITEVSEDREAGDITGQSNSSGTAHEMKFQPVRRRRTRKSYPYERTTTKCRAAEEISRDMESLY